MRFVRHPVVGFVALYVVTSLLLWPGLGLVLLAAIAIAPPLIWLSLQDLRNLTIPDHATLALVLVSVIFLFATTPDAFFFHAVAGLGLAGLLWGIGEVYFRRTGQEGLGLGDAKLFGAGAFLLGPAQLPDLLLLASLGGVVGYLLSIRSTKNIHAKGIPFGPFIAYAVFVLHLIDPLFL